MDEFSTDNLGCYVYMIMKWGGNNYLLFIKDLLKIDLYHMVVSERMDC